MWVRNAAAQDGVHLDCVQSSKPEKEENGATNIYVY